MHRFVLVGRRSFHTAKERCGSLGYCEAQGLSLKTFGNWRAKFKLLYRRGGLSHRPLSHSLTARRSRRSSLRRHCDSESCILGGSVGRFSHYVSKDLIVANEKGALPTWIDVKASLLSFDRAGLLGLVQDLYAASKDNQALLHARLGLGPDQLKPYKATISCWINPDLMRGGVRLNFKSQESNRGLQESHWTPEGLGRTIDILLRGGIQFHRILQLCRYELLCCPDPNVRSIGEARIEPSACRATRLR
jgi:hypothetical protein